MPQDCAGGAAMWSRKSTRGSRRDEKIDGSTRSLYVPGQLFLTVNPDSKRRGEKSRCAALSPTSSYFCV
jgi:hypothetical protein